MGRDRGRRRRTTRRPAEIVRLLGLLPACRPISLFSSELPSCPLSSCLGIVGRRLGVLVSCSEGSMTLNTSCECDKPLLKEESADIIFEAGQPPPGQINCEITGLQTMELAHGGSCRIMWSHCNSPSLYHPSILLPSGMVDVPWPFRWPSFHSPSYLPPLK